LPKNEQVNVVVTLLKEFLLISIYLLAKKVKHSSKYVSSKDSNFTNEKLVLYLFYIDFGKLNILEKLILELEAMSKQVILIGVHREIYGCSKNLR